MTNEAVGLLVLRAGRRVDGQHGGVVRGLKTGAVTAATPGSARSASCTRSTATRSAAVGTSTTTTIGPLKPRPKPSASVVVGDALGLAGAGVAVVGRADAHAQRRHRDDAQPDEAGNGVAHGMLTDVMGPATGDRLVCGLGHVRLAVDRELVDLRAGQAEQAGEQGDRRDHRRRSTTSAIGDAHRADRGDPGEVADRGSRSRPSSRRTAPTCRRWRSPCPRRRRRSCLRAGAGGGG